MEKKSLQLEKKTYIAPKIEVVEIELEQNIFAGSSGPSSLPGMPGSDW